MTKKKEKGQTGPFEMSKKWQLNDIVKNNYGSP